ncbi:MAG: hypothetical protein NZM26_04960 [Patescibacteria group bacterium]|nr:hypothetical protein [Patescibacteria group bacterium]
MSKANFKFLAQVVLVFGTFILLVFPHNLHAARGREIKESSNPSEFSSKFGVCSRIDKIYENVENRAREREQSLRQKLDKRKENLEERQNRRAQLLQERRRNWDENRNERYEILMSKAKTEEQKLAVANFKSAVEAAVQKRRDIIDRAVQDFRKGMDSAVKNREDAVKKAVETYQKNRKEAFEKARTACQAGKDPSEIRATLHSDLEAAVKKFRSDKSSVEKIGESVKSLSEARKLAVEQAVNDFRATLKAEVSKLRSALEEDDDNV